MPAPISDYHERKAWRKKFYEENCVGWKKRTCGACNGSGRYDHNGSPKCGCCGGSGKERYKPYPHELAD